MSSKPKRGRWQVTVKPNPPVTYLYADGSFKSIPSQHQQETNSVTDPSTSCRSTVDGVVGHNTLSNVPDPGHHQITTKSDSIEQPDEVDGYKAKKAKVSAKWNEIMQQIVEQFVKNEYPSSFLCCLCDHPEPVQDIFRCSDCGPNAYFCSACVKTHHTVTVLHNVERWNAEMGFFESHDLNIAWQRPNKHNCNTESVMHMLIIDEKGRQFFQSLHVCSCKPLPVILIEYGLWPASPSSPKIAFTIELMKTLRALVLEGQTSIKSFCAAIQESRQGLSRNIKSQMVEDMYRVLNWETVLNFMWVFHNVSTLQFAAIGLRDGTECLACPQEGSQSGRRVTMDGNMNLVRRSKAGHSVREPLHADRFFLPQQDVDKYVLEREENFEPKDQSCSNFQAASVIRTKNKSAKLEFTGVFASVCNHDFPCKILNMRHGERMSYPLFMMRNLVNVDILMYDLGCLLDTVLKKRSIDNTPKLAVPIFHVYGHKMSCQLLYNPRSTSGAGLFDGEGTERAWSYLGKFSSITKEMTAENRHDLITEALLHYGNKINRKMSLHLSDRLTRAMMLKEATLNQMEQDLSLLPGVTLDSIQMWSLEEKKIASTCLPKQQDPWESSYALLLHEYFRLSDSIREEEMDADSEMVDDCARIETSLKRHEKRHGVERRWSKVSKLYKYHLGKACGERRIFLLEQLRDQVVQYNFMLTMKSKYARGQSLAKRITKQIVTASRKVTKALASYNDVPPHGPSSPPHTLLRQNAVDLGDDIWQNLSPISTMAASGVPQCMKRKLIDSFHLFNRSKEEISLVTDDFKRLVLAFGKDEDKVVLALQTFDLLSEMSEYELACTSLLKKHLAATRYFMQSAQCMAEKCSSPLTTTIDEFLISVGEATSSVTNSSQMFEEVMAEVEAFEQNLVCDDDSLSEETGST